MQVEPVMALMRRLQRMLPNDIAIRSIKEAPEGFDARFSALERTYVYRIADRSSEIDPRIRNSVLHIDDDLDIDAMNKAAEMTIGLHDFGSFATPNPGGTTIRKVKPRIEAHTAASAYRRRNHHGGAVPNARLGVGTALLHHRRRRIRTQYGAFVG